VTVNH